MKKRVYISEPAYRRLKEMASENKERLKSNKGLLGMLDILILGETTSKGGGRPKKSDK